MTETDWTQGPTFEVGHDLSIAVAGPWGLGLGSTDGWVGVTHNDTIRTIRWMPAVVTQLAWCRWGGQPTLMAGANTGTVALCQLEGDTIEFQASRADRLRMCATDTILAVTSPEGDVVIWDLIELAVSHRILGGGGANRLSISETGDAPRVFMSTSDGGLTAWTPAGVDPPIVPAGFTFTEFEPIAPDAVVTMAADGTLSRHSPGSPTLTLGSDGPGPFNLFRVGPNLGFRNGNTALILDPATLRVLHELDHPLLDQAISLTSDGITLVAALTGGRVTSWRTPSTFRREPIAPAAQPKPTRAHRLRTPVVQPIDDAVSWLAPTPTDDSDLHDAWLASHRYAVERLSSITPLPWEHMARRPGAFAGPATNDPALTGMLASAIASVLRRAAAPGAALTDLLVAPYHEPGHLPLSDQLPGVDTERGIRPSLTPAALDHVLDSGSTLILTHLDRSEPQLDLILGLVETIFTCPAGCNAYVSRGPARGFGAHWDDHEVMVTQIHGRKDWRIYESAEPFPTRDRVAPNQAGAQAAELRLHPGHTLWIPRGWTHETQGTADISMHTSIWAARASVAALLAGTVSDPNRPLVPDMDPTSSALDLGAFDDPRAVRQLRRSLGGYRWGLRLRGAHDPLSTTAPFRRNAASVLARPVQCFAPGGLVAGEGSLPGESRIGVGGHTLVTNEAGRALLVALASGRPRLIPEVASELNLDTWATINCVRGLAGAGVVTLLEPTTQPS